MPSVAFFPWWSIREPLSVGDVRLLPYSRGQLPGSTPRRTQADLDGVLGAYALRKDRPVASATLLEKGEWTTGDESNDSMRSELFRVRELLAFTCLAGRQLFRDTGYCNYDSFSFFIQNYTPGDTRHFAFSTRRRDGSVRHLWGAEEFAFLRPLHVDDKAAPELDVILLQALLEADATGQVPFAAISEFNRANTDSQDMPVPSELVMTKSAFEYFLEVGHKCDDMIRKLLPLIPQRPQHIPFSGPLLSKWPTTNKRGATTRPIEAWGRELCAHRNESAHGAARGANQRLVWSVHAHLAFAAVLLPLLVKQQLHTNGYFKMEERDSIQLEVIESYLMCDPFDARVVDEDGTVERPWSKIYSNIVVHELLRRDIAKQLRVTSSNGIPHE